MLKSKSSKPLKLLKNNKKLLQLFWSTIKVSLKIMKVMPLLTKKENQLKPPNNRKLLLKKESQSL